MSETGSFPSGTMPRGRQIPTYLGIGVPRAGTTWLHDLLGSHPEVYVPSRRKELSYFNLNYERGPAWYRKFFPPEAEQGRYRAIGEVTPYYFYCDDCPERMVRAGVEKLVLILRHPVDRAWSYYGQKIRNGMYRGSFEEFLRQSRWPVVDQGHYSRYLSRYLHYFDRRQILVLLFEEALPDIRSTTTILGSFLGVDAAGFAGSAAAETVNSSYVPRSRLLYGLAFRVAKVCRQYDLDWVVNAAKHLGIREAFGVGGKLAPMKLETRTRLEASFQPEIAELERLLDRPLDLWRQPRPGFSRADGPGPALTGTDRGTDLAYEGLRNVSPPS